jgi:intein/homing endonuclease
MNSKAAIENKRIKFLPGEQSKFLQKVAIASTFSSVQLAEIVGVHPRSFLDWKLEKLTMTLAAAEIFSGKFNVNLLEEKETLVERWRNNKRESCKMGGISRFIKYGSPATAQGRSKGGLKALTILRQRGIIPSFNIYNLPREYNEKLAEYVGILLGDGGITLEQCFITLNSEADKEYVTFVAKFGEILFGKYPKLLKRKDSKAIIIYYNGILLVQFLIKIGLKIGNKVKQQVGVPEWILQSQQYRIACLRGLMDTDGGVFLHKYTVRGKKYMYRKISFSNRSLPLLLFVRETLESLGLTPKIIDNVENKKVWLYNDNEVSRYLELVGSHNQRLLQYEILEGGLDGKAQVC